MRNQTFSEASRKYCKWTDTAGEVQYGKWLHSAFETVVVLPYGGKMRVLKKDDVTEITKAEADLHRKGLPRAKRPRSPGVR